MTGGDSSARSDLTRRMSRDVRKSIIEAHEVLEARKRQQRSWLCPCYIPKRLIMVILCFLGMFVIHAMRVNVAVAVITLMDEQVHVKVGTPKAVSNILKIGVKWDTRMIGFLHSIFYVGFLITQIPGGFLVTKIPSHRVFGASILFSCTLNLLLPVAIAEIGYWFTCLVRFAQGLSEGLAFPACYRLLSLWTLGPDQSKMASFVVTGVYAGAIFGFPISGFLTHFVGWQHVFFLNGGIGVVWFIFWLWLAFEKPEYHPDISRKELDYILENQEDASVDEEVDYFTCDEESETGVPWKSILTSVPVLALCVCHFARSWMFFLLLTNEPAYINVFGFTIAANGILSSIPHVVMVVISACSGPLADCLIKRPPLNTTHVRKLFTCLGFGAESLACVALTFVSKGNTAMITLSIGVGLSGLTTSGWQINHLDIAPRYAGILIGITTAVGTVGGIISPLVVGVITYKQTLRSWQLSWLLTGMVLMVGVIFYGLFASGEKQSWANPGKAAAPDKADKGDKGGSKDKSEPDSKPESEGEPLANANSTNYGTNTEDKEEEKEKE